MTFGETPQPPSMALSRKAAYSLFGGSAITLVSGFLPNMTLLGMSSYGYPFPWLAQFVYPGAGPMTLLVIGLLLDLLVWSAVTFVLLTFFQMLRKRSSQSSKAAQI
ncbi:MAG: hypothetical protein JSW61_05915 [Candidatus Thorarchaeota archaeon]|nr:MAG: hypothetical protein JSW61_05915 [Candidatus Thorarchaeota archaeon]